MQCNVLLSLENYNIIKNKSKNGLKEHYTLSQALFPSPFDYFHYKYTYLQCMN